MRGTDLTGGVQPRARRAGTGQASVELLLAVPLVLLVGLALWQLALAGQTLWLCANAARVGARAEAVGEDAERAARTALPDGLEQGLRVRAGDSGEVEVSVRLPFVVRDWQTPIPIAASARLEPAS
jgi:hypothetical protein